MFSTYAPPPQLSTTLPRRTDSLSSTIPKQPKLASPLVQSREDAKYARIVLTASVTNGEDKLHLDDEEAGDDHRRVLTEMLDRMTGWVEELATLLQQAYKNQTELETALTLARSNLQLALANNEMLEEALKRGGGSGQDVGWRRWSEREGVRRSGPAKDYAQSDRPNSVPDGPPPPQQHPPSLPSRFFSFKSSLQRMSNTNTSPTATSASPPYASASASASASTSSLLPPISIPSSSRNGSRAASPAPLVTTNAASDLPTSRPSTPSPTHPIPPISHSHYTSRSLSTQPTAREKELTSLLDKERAALKALGDAKAQLEDELESLSQALFEEANKMVSVANRKLAETEEELRIATAQKEALRGALRIVEGENGALRGVGGNDPDVDQGEMESTARVTGIDEQRMHLNKKGGDVSHPDDGDKTNLSSNLQKNSQFHPALHDSTHPAHPSQSQSHNRPTIPAVTVTAQRSTDERMSFWSPVTPLNDAGEDEARSTPKLSQPSLLSSSPSPSPSPMSPAPVEAPPKTSTHTDSLNPNAPAPISTTQTTQAGTRATTIHRWSVLPVTPTSRTAVRNEFEDAMRRMRELVGEGEEEDGVTDEMDGKRDEAEHVVEGGYLGEEKEGDVEAARTDEGVNPWRT